MNVPLFYPKLKWKISEVKFLESPIFDLQKRNIPQKWNFNLAKEFLLKALLNDCLPSKIFIEWLFTMQKLYKMTAYQAKTL